LISGSRDKTIRVWDIKTGLNIGTFTGHDNWINDLQFHANGKYLFSASDDKTVKIWDLKTGRNVRTINNAHDNFVTTIAFKGKVMASGSANFTIKLWKGN
jgi:platelet-activating factor acetylhydrolase IB subunit alpha